MVNNRQKHYPLNLPIFRSAPSIPARLSEQWKQLEPLAKLKDLPVQVLPALTEINVGDWQGKSIPALRRLELWREIHEEPARFSFPNGESFSDKQHVIVAALEKLIRECQCPISHCLCLTRGSDQTKPGLFPGLGLEQLPTHRHRSGICKFRLFFRFACQTRPDQSGGRNSGGSPQTMIRG